MTIRQALEQAAHTIERRDAELLLQSILGSDRAWILAHPEAAVGVGAHQAFADQVARRAGHWPLQYLTGHQEFFGLDLVVTPAVLIPRPETELLVEAVLAWLRPETRQASLRIADVGTGSGAIALALAHELPAASLTALDLSPAVRPILELNATRLGLAGRVRFVLADLLQPLQPLGAWETSFDVIVSNPPYVPSTDAPTLAPQVRDFEPHTALFAGEDGLSVYRRLIPQAWQALPAGGLLAMEFGFGQQPALEALLDGWQNVRFGKDYAGIPRFVLAERPAPG